MHQTAHSPPSMAAMGAHKHSQPNNEHISHTYITAVSTRSPHGHGPWPTMCKVTADRQRETTRIQFRKAVTVQWRRARCRGAGAGSDCWRMAVCGTCIFVELVYGSPQARCATSTCCSCTRRSRRCATGWCKQWLQKGTGGRRRANRGWQWCS